MIKSKSFVTLFCAVFIALTCSVPTLAADIDIGEWNNCDTLYPILTGEASSNSSIEYIFLKAKYDRSSNRVRLLFMTEQSDFPEEITPGVSMKIKDGEEISLHINKDTEYDNEKYYAQIDYLADPQTSTLYLEVTLGIKDGIPEKLVLQFQLYDAAGIATNVYTVDLSESVQETTTTATTEAQTKPDRTTKTKPKTEKTTKTRSTKTTAGKTYNESALSSTEIAINADTHSEEAPSFGNAKLVGSVAASAAALAGICTCIARIFKRSKK